MSSHTHNSKTSIQTNRRLFLQYLSASPLFIGLASPAGAGQSSPADAPFSLEEGDLRIWDMDLRAEPIRTPDEALDLFDLELAAQRAQPPAHFGFVATGVDGNATLKANNADFQKFGLIPRRMAGPFPGDMTTTIFGESFASPIFTCPAGAAWFDATNEAALAKVTAANNHLQVIGASKVEAAAKANGGKVPWTQMYCDTDFDKNVRTIKEMEDLGSKVLVVTVDIIGLRKSVMYERIRRADRMITDYVGRGSTGATMKHDFDWDFMRRLKEKTKMKIIPKGIMSSEDAALCVKHGMDGVFVSNHGGRADDFGISTISMLPEIVEAVNGKIPIFLDGGIRRGVDVAKAIAMGATMVGIGRPWLWGLGAFGEAGVARVLELLRTETQYTMQQAGADTLKDLSPSMIRKL